MLAGGQLIVRPAHIRQADITLNTYPPVRAQLIGDARLQTQAEVLEHLLANKPINRSAIQVVFVVLQAIGEHRPQTDDPMAVIV